MIAYQSHAFAVLRKCEMTHEELLLYCFFRHQEFPIRGDRSERLQTEDCEHREWTEIPQPGGRSVSEQIETKWMSVWLAGGNSRIAFILQMIFEIATASMCVCVLLNIQL